MKKKIIIVLSLLLSLLPYDVFAYTRTPGGNSIRSTFDTVISSNSETLGQGCSNNDAVTLQYRDYNTASFYTPNQNCTSGTCQANHEPFTITVSTSTVETHDVVQVYLACAGTPVNTAEGDGSSPGNIVFTLEYSGGGGGGGGATSTSSTTFSGVIVDYNRDVFLGIGVFGFFMWFMVWLLKGK